QGAQLFEEQGQIVFDARRNHAATQVLVDRTATVVDLEALAKARPEAGQSALVEGEFPGRQQVDLLDLVDGALAFRIEGAQGLDFIVEQVNPVGQATAHREQVEQ